MKINSETEESVVEENFLDMTVEDARREAARLRTKLYSLEQKNDRLTDALSKARNSLSELRAQIHALGQPPLQNAVFEMADYEDRQAQVAIGSKRWKVGVSKDVNLTHLLPGDCVLLNQSLAVVGQMDSPPVGQVVLISEVLPQGRAVVRGSSGEETVVNLSVRMGECVAGDTVVADLSSRWALELVERSHIEQSLIPEVPNVSWSDIGGLDFQIDMIREAIELPFTHRQLYASYGLQAPKGILLYGPPGCGKTLIAKAIATSLAGSDSESKGAYFLSIKGPELLSKFVGETERQIRAIFSRARELSSQDVPVVVFFDEMEALFRTRGTGVSSDVETMVVPQLLAEMDGIDRHSNVVVIGASNREDMIDPAVLRPGRLDVKIEIGRPSRSAARDILSLYLNEDVPFAPELLEGSTSKAACEMLVDMCLDFIYDPDRMLLQIELQSGQVHPVHMSDLVSGAMLAALVRQAKNTAVRRTLEGQDSGVNLSDMKGALQRAAREASSFLAWSSTKEWARVLRLEVGAISQVKMLEQET